LIEKAPFETLCQIGLLINTNLTDSESTNIINGLDVSITSSFLTSDTLGRILECEEIYKLDILKNIAPKEIQLSNEVTEIEYVVKLQKTSPVFLRCIGAQKHLAPQLVLNNIEHKLVNQNCLLVKASSKLDTLNAVAKKEFYVQDWASQQTLNFIDCNDSETWWDVCSGAGGKSLLMLSAHKKLQIVASDIRKTIIHNYKKRLAFYGYAPKAKSIDIINQPITIPHLNGAVIDAPCTGSGVWGRTPEGISQITAKAVKSYQAKQKAICSTVVKNLPNGGKLTYITCSVFKAENEDVSAFIHNTLGLKLIKQGIIHNHELNSDYLFAAQFIKQT
ncbi:MAG: hypothetical protein ACPGLV_16735, partial [Bacteroidia bacterium]